MKGKTLIITCNEENQKKSGIHGNNIMQVVLNVMIQKFVI